MAKPRATITIALPPWPGKSEAYLWRKEVLHRLNEKKQKLGSSLARDAQVEVEATVFLVRTRKGAEGQDVDNLLKHICDALQARRGGAKGKRRKGKLIDNDHQVFRAVVEKRYLRKKNKSGGRLTVRPYRG